MNFVQMSRSLSCFLFIAEATTPDRPRRSRPVVYPAFLDPPLLWGVPESPAIHAVEVYRRRWMTRNMLLRLELLVFLAMVSAGCQVVEGIFKAGMWVGILLVVVVLGIVYMLFGRSKT